ncbi:MAG: LemA family protein [Phycisphaera sp. TMED9]|nr:MAG: LemA family protein [Phycisphaera sp. TMED9]
MPAGITILALSQFQIVAVVIGVTILIAAGITISMYNRLVKARQFCKESWSDADTELQRRHDLIPNLVTTVKGYATHETTVLEDVTRLRAQAVADKDADPKTRAQIEDQLGAAAKGLVATFEAYPDLKANANFLKLQEELGATETRIARARRFYNSNVRDFLTAVTTFPSSVIAGLTGFSRTEFEYFKADDASRAPIDVDLGT